MFSGVNIVPHPPLPPMEGNDFARGEAFQKYKKRERKKRRKKEGKKERGKEKEREN